MPSSAMRPNDWRAPRFLQQKGSFSETKKEIGLRHTYARAPAGFQSGTDIAGHIIQYLFAASGLAVATSTALSSTTP